MVSIICDFLLKLDVVPVGPSGSWAGPCCVHVCAVGEQHKVQQDGRELTIFQAEEGGLVPQQRREVMPGTLQVLRKELSSSE